MKKNALLSAQLLVLPHHRRMVIEIDIRDTKNGQCKRRRRVGLAGSRRPLQNDTLLALQQLRGLCNHLFAFLIINESQNVSETALSAGFLSTSRA